MRNWAWPQPCRKQGLNMTPVRWGMAAVPVGGRAWPDNESTRRAKLAARTDRGRVATHRHTQRPGTTGVEGAGGTGGYGQASRQRTETHTSMPVAAGVEGAGGPGCGARGRRRGLAGLREDAPSEARGAGGSRAGRRPREQPAARPSRARKAPGPTAHQRGHKQHSTGARARRPAPLDATTQTRVLRSTCVPCRSARAARQWRRSSRSPHLRRRAGPRR